MFDRIPVWLQGAIVRAIRTFIITVLGLLAAIPIVGLSLQDYLQALAVAAIPALLAGIDKAIREFRAAAGEGVINEVIPPGS